MDEIEVQSQIPEKITRVQVPELDNILGIPFKVLDEGFVRVVDYMGSDASIVQAARVSYGTGTKKISEDRGLIRYLMRHRHSTPFEMAEIKFHVRVPMDCWRQWIRHRMANVNEYSTRYSEAIDASQKTPPDKWRLQSELNKQGSGGYLTDAEGSALSLSEEMFQKGARELYSKRLEMGVAREQARKDLPLSTYTEAYWKCDLHNLLHFLGLRMDGHAQEEIRNYATVIGEQIVAKWVPFAWEAFNDYRMKGAHFSRMETEIFEAICGNNSAKAMVLASTYGWLDKNDKGKLKSNRERAELEAKLLKFNLAIPWK